MSHRRNGPDDAFSASLIDWLTGISSSSLWVFCLGGCDGVLECNRNALRDIPAVREKGVSYASRDTVAS